MGKARQPIVKRRRVRGVMIVAGSFLAGGIVLAWFANSWIRRTTSSYLYSVPGEVPPRQVAIVPGARVYSDGTPSAVLEDRLNGALELYRRGVVQRILVSGDHRDDGYDEVNAMQRWLVARDVPEDAVFMDHAGTVVRHPRSLLRHRTLARPVRSFRIKTRGPRRAQRWSSAGTVGSATLDHCY